MLFHVEAAAKSRFAADFNHELTALHARIQELLVDRPELAAAQEEASGEEPAARDPAAATSSCGLSANGGPFS